MGGKTISALALCLVLGPIGVGTGRASGDVNKLKHIIVVMQENHSFDNYLGVLPYAQNAPYHKGPCAADDQSCVDGLNCERNKVNGKYECHSSNREDGDKGKKVFAFHSSDSCVRTD